MGDPISESAARKGSAELLILSALEESQLHGYDIAREISRIAGRWVEKTRQRRRRYYRLTAEGRTVLAKQRGRWEAFVAALTRAAGLKHTGTKSGSDRPDGGVTGRIRRSNRRKEGCKH